jgi:hypothetical protein
MKRWFQWLDFYSPDGRKAWAFWAILLGCGIMTAMAAVALYLVRANPAYVFWLGLAAHAQIGIALTGFIAFFVRRDVEITKDSVRIKDLPVQNEGNLNAILTAHEQDFRGVGDSRDSVPRSGRDRGQSGDEREGGGTEQG